MVKSMQPQRNYTRKCDCERERECECECEYEYEYEYECFVGIVSAFISVKVFFFSNRGENVTYSY